MVTNCGDGGEREEYWVVEIPGGAEIFIGWRWRWRNNGFVVVVLVVVEVEESLVEHVKVDERAVNVLDQQLEA